MSAALVIWAVAVLVVAGIALVWAESERNR